MPLNIDEAEAERLVAEVCPATGKNEAEAIRRALRERRDGPALRGSLSERRASIVRWLEEDVWPRIPSSQMGRRLSAEEEAEILG